MTMLSDWKRSGMAVDAPAGPDQLILSHHWHGWQRWVKRSFDLVVAAGLLVLLAPVLALVALAIRLDSAGPIIFRQTRCGRDGRPFTVLKFRSMTIDAESRRAELEAFNEADGPIFKLRQDPRVTRVGRWLRRLSIDELPQLWNVVRGDMSLIGPRPPLPSEVTQYMVWHRGRLLVTGGVTGLWQVSGRSELTFDDMVRLDLAYIRNWSLWLDIQILMRTVLVLITARGAY